MYFTKILRFVLTFLFLCLFVSAVYAQAPINQIVITALETPSFPEVKLQVRVLDAYGRSIPGLDAASLVITEDGQPVNPESMTEVDSEIWVQFVIDAGLRMSQASSWDHTKEAILHFVQGTQGVHLTDHIAITTFWGDGNVQQVTDFSMGGEAIINTLNGGYTPPRCTNVNCSSNPILALEKILLNLETNTEAQNRPKMIVLFTSEVEKGTARISELAQNALLKGIPIYVVRVSTTGNGDSLSALAQGSGGEFVQYENSSNLSEFYNTMLSRYRSQYEIVYRSGSSVSTERTVKVTSATTILSDERQYTVVLEPPRVIIKFPEEGDTVELTSPDAQQRVEAQVIFLDGHPRYITSAVLWVNGQEVDNVGNIVPSEQVLFSWGNNLITESGDVRLEVQVIDELGLISLKEVVHITVILPTPIPSTPTAEPTVTISPTSVPTPEPPGEDPPYLILGISGLAGILSLSFLVILIRNWGREESVIHKVGGMVRKTIKLITGQKPKAYLVLREGNTSKDYSPIGREWTFDSTITLGRVNAMYRFQQNEENSPISGLHCTLLDREDHFEIRDEGSVNGTFLNNRRLEERTPVRLKHGDQIELAQVELGGVRLEFKLTNTPSQQQPDDWNEPGGGNKADVNLPDNDQNGSAPDTVYDPEPRF